jgi:tripartite-type tricarboxylate transporter receptor subunit TctC
MRPNFSASTTIFILWLSLVSPGNADEPFYKDKTVRIVLGHSPGGGYDAYTRLIARHIGKYIPGSPHVIVENMAGAGSLVSANYNYKIAKPNGLTIGHFSGGLIAQQLLGQPGVQFDARKFEYLGAPAQDDYAIGLTRASGVTSMEKWLAAKTAVKLGGTAPGGASIDVPKILQAALGLPMQLVSGYQGTAEIRLAAERGEVAGFCTGWESFKSTWRDALDGGEAVIVVQIVPRPNRELPNVPLAVHYAKTDEARKLIQAGVHDAGAVARPYTLPPGTPKDRVQALRKAFEQTMKDAEFLADAKKSKLDVEPLTGEALEKIVNGFFRTDAAIIKRWKEIVSSD